MINRIKLREALSFIILVFAMVLFGFAVSFSQTTTVDVTNENGKVHIRTETIENGKSVRRDTSFTFDGKSDLDNLIKFWSGFNSDSADIKVRKNVIKINKNKDTVNDSESNFKNSIEERREEIREALEELKHELNTLREELEGNQYEIEKEIIVNENEVQKESIDDFSDNEELNSLNIEDHILIEGKPGEKPPVFEKSVTTKNGKEVFVFKRMGTPRENNGDDFKFKPDEDEVNIFPNPSTGIVTIDCKLRKASEFTIQVFDLKNTAVFNKKFSKKGANFREEMDLSKLGKGSYTLSITYGKNKVTKTFVLQ